MKETNKILEDDLRHLYSFQTKEDLIRQVKVLAKKYPAIRDRQVIQEEAIKAFSEMANRQSEKEESMKKTFFSIPAKRLKKLAATVGLVVTMAGSMVACNSNNKPKVASSNPYDGQTVTCEGTKKKITLDETFSHNAATDTSMTETGEALLKDFASVGMLDDSLQTKAVLDINVIANMEYPNQFTEERISQLDMSNYFTTAEDFEKSMDVYAVLVEKSIMANINRDAAFKQLYTKKYDQKTVMNAHNDVMEYVKNPTKKNAKKIHDGIYEIVNSQEKLGDFAKIELSYTYAALYNFQNNEITKDEQEMLRTMGIDVNCKIKNAESSKVNASLFTNSSIKIRANLKKLETKIRKYKEQPLCNLVEDEEKTYSELEQELIKIRKTVKNKDLDFKALSYENQDRLRNSAASGGTTIAPGTPRTPDGSINGGSAGSTGKAGDVKNEKVYDNSGKEVSSTEELKSKYKQGSTDAYNGTKNNLLYQTDSTYRNGYDAAISAKKEVDNKVDKQGPTAGEIKEQQKENGSKDKSDEIYNNIPDNSIIIGDTTKEETIIDDKYKGHETGEKDANGNPIYEIEASAEELQAEIQKQQASTKAGNEASPAQVNAEIEALEQSLQANQAAQESLKQLQNELSEQTDKTKGL